MAKGFLARTVTPAVKEMQEHYYGEAGNVPEMKDVSLRARETDFIASNSSRLQQKVTHLEKSCYSPTKPLGKRCKPRGFRSVGRLETCPT